ncbi:hypothetical protein ACFS5M_14090 [Lacinutrix iliipiscaria]|uniref:Uncharacterized protein n=1 Tax=Lacinutrix iliipiscaria TaxID=1230532 RepID=A0ABW5WR40_9FLAO
MKLIKWIINFFKKIKRRFIIAKAYVKMQGAFKKQLSARKALRKDVNSFLKDFFGIDANSKYIPKDYKNKEEVRIAVTTKFEERMNNLNLSYTDLFK